MPSSSDDQFPIRTGVWTNWSRGQVMGATLTMKRQEYDLLIAFTASFVALVATRVWAIVRFIFHRCYSTSGPQDAVYHQRQAILRNSQSPDDVIFMVGQMIWTWRHRTSRRRLCSLLPVVIFAILSVSVFTIAGGFSSRISTAVGSEVLIQTTNCGFEIPASYFYDPDLFFDLRPAVAENMDSAANYAQQCYPNGSSRSLGQVLDCSRYITKSLPIAIVDEAASCPFNNELCRNQTGNLRLDSGYINSHNNLGLNAPDDERILWRNVLHCAPIVTEGFTSQETTLYGNFTHYHYGSYNESTANGTFQTLDYVYSVPDVQLQYFSEGLTSSKNYLLQSLGASVKNHEIYLENSDFLPIDSLVRPDADTYLIFLSGNGVSYIEPNDDPWYRTQGKTGEYSINYAMQSAELAHYLPQEAASPLACAAQYQICRRNSGNCGPLGSSYDAANEAAPLFNTSVAKSAPDIAPGQTANSFNYFMQTFGYNYFSPSDVVGYLGPRSLRSQQTLTGGFQGPLASNQWQLDVTHWFDICLSSLQAAFVNTASGPTNPVYLKGRINYTTPELQKLCNNQKIKSTVYASFNLFWLCFTFVVGFLLTLISFLLEPLYAFLHKRGYKQHAHLEWTTNSTLQLQRLAHEDIGQGTWSRGTKNIPVTAAAELLGCLDITDLKHPVISAPSEKELKVHDLSSSSGELPTHFGEEIASLVGPDGDYVSGDESASQPISGVPDENNPTSDKTAAGFGNVRTGALITDQLT